MEWLNFHHLRYFWIVAKKGGVRKAADELHVSQPSISAQLRLLEESLGEKLFQRSGRNLILTETGHLVLSYADEIFSSGRELLNAVKQRPGKRALKLNIGITDAVSKLITYEILKAAFRFGEPVRIVCREGELGPLVQQLQAHRLDIVLADEPASSSLKTKTFNHRLVPTVVDRAALKHYGLRVIAKVEECGSDFYAITAERRVKHPAAVVITKHAYSNLFA